MNIPTANWLTSIRGSLDLSCIHSRTRTSGTPQLDPSFGNRAEVHEPASCYTSNRLIALAVAREKSQVAAQAELSA